MRKQTRQNKLKMIKWISIWKLIPLFKKEKIQSPFCHSTSQSNWYRERHNKRFATSSPLLNLWMTFHEFKLEKDAYREKYQESFKAERRGSYHGYFIKIEFAFKRANALESFQLLSFVQCGAFLAPTLTRQHYATKEKLG